MEKKQVIFIMTLTIVLTVTAVIIFFMTKPKTEEEPLVEGKYISVNNNEVIYHSAAPLNGKFYTCINENCKLTLIEGSDRFGILVDDELKYIYDWNKNKNFKINELYSYYEFIYSTEKIIYMKSKDNAMYYMLEEEKEIVLSSDLEMTDAVVNNGITFVSYKNLTENKIYVINYDTKEVVFEEKVDITNMSYEFEIIKNKCLVVLKEDSNSGEGLLSVIIYDLEKKVILDNLVDYVINEENIMGILKDNSFITVDNNGVQIYASRKFDSIALEYYDRSNVLVTLGYNAYIMDETGKIVLETPIQNFKEATNTSPADSVEEEYKFHFDLKSDYDITSEGLFFNTIANDLISNKIYFYDFNTKQAIVLNAE